MKKALILVSAIIMATVSAHAQGNDNADDELVLISYLTDENRPQATKILPQPPSTTGGDFANDFYYYQWGKEQRKIPEIHDAAIRNDTIKIFKAFSDSLGIKLSKSKTPEIINLVETAAADGRLAVKKAQKHFGRMKPYRKFNEPSLKPTAEGEQSLKGGLDNSYPSGHATRGWIYALVLSTVAPERTEQLMNCAQEYAMLRVIMGRHWKSDIDAGLIVAAAIFSNIVVTDAYQEQLVKARAEYQAIKNRVKTVTDK